MTGGRPVTGVREALATMVAPPDPDDEPPDPLEQVIRGTTTVGFYRTTPDGELLEANPALLDMFGCRSLDELSDQGLEAFHLDGRPGDHRKGTIARTGSARAMSATYRRADGSTIHVRESVRPVRDEDGDVRWYVGTMEDVTDLVRAQRMMADANSRLRHLVSRRETTLEAVGAGVLVVDLEGRVVDHNDRFLEIWDLPETVLEAGGLASILDIVRDRLADPEAAAAWSDPPPDIGEPSSHVLELEDGRSLERHVEPRRTRDEVVGHVWSFRDVTDRHRRRRRLERSNEDLERFASALSHDLREPMRMVTSFLELLERRLDDDLEGETRELLDHARGGAERASAMTESLLRLSSVGTSSDPLAPVDLDAVMEAAVDQLRLRIDETGAEVVADELPVVGGDRDQLTELLQNLVDNAIKYGPEDAPPRIEIRADEGPGMCTIRVADDGQGMDEATSGRAFGVFERGADADRTAEGIGMGLAICRRIVDRHGGEIWIEETAPGEGTTIAFTLPTAGSAADAPAGPPVPVAREG